MSLLQIIISVTGFVFFLMALDLYERKKFTLLHFIVFFWWTAFIVLFSFKPDLLNQFWRFFGVARWADMLVYISIIWLAYFYFELLNKHNTSSFIFSKFVTKDAYKRWIHNNIELLRNPVDGDFCFLVRAYNEWPVVYTALENIYNAWYTAIVVCNDWSIDQTESEIARFKHDYPDCWCIDFHHTINRWWWAANKTLFNFVRNRWKQLWFQWCVTFDPDWQMALEDMKTFKQAIKDHPDAQAFLWTRFKEWWWAKNIWPVRRVILRWSRIITFIFNRVLVSDPHNGYRILSVDAFEKIRLESDGMIYASELIEQLHQHNIPFKEVPVMITYSQYSLNKWQKNSNAFIILKELLLTKFIFKK